MLLTLIKTIESVLENNYSKIHSLLPPKLAMNSLEKGQKGQKR